MVLKLQADHQFSDTKTRVVFVHQDLSPKDKKKNDQEPALYIPGATKGLKSLADQLAKSGQLKGSFKFTFYAPFIPENLAKELGSKSILFVGVGNLPRTEDERAEHYRRIGAVMAKTLEGLQTDEGLIDCATVNEGKMNERLVVAVAEGASLGHYSFQIYKKKQRPLKLGTLTFVSPAFKAAAANKKIEEGLGRASILANAVHTARDLGNLPPNDLTPAALADRAKELSKKNGISCDVWDMKDIIKEKFGLLHAVGKGTENEPRFIVMEYNKQKKNLPHLCFVGKGLTFDSGGISIKPATDMDHMKWDMCGSAAVIGATVAIAQLELPVRLTTLVPAAENMSGDKAYRPGDVIKSHKGLHVEITNTDAEGRLVLADALSYAQQLKPDLIIDVATLTGAVTVALGAVYSGIMGTSDKLLRLIKEAASTSGEAVWELPMSPYFEDDMDSAIGDVRNSGGRGAGSSKGGIFLRRFIDPGVAWAHIDMAGVAYEAGHFDYHPKKSASGVIVRLLATFAENFKKL